MIYTESANFLTAPLALRSGKRVDYFPHFTIGLGVALAIFSLVFGAPRPPGVGAEPAVVVYGP